MIPYSIQISSFIPARGIQAAGLPLRLLLSLSLTRLLSGRRA